MGTRDCSAQDRDPDRRGCDQWCFAEHDQFLRAAVDGRGRSSAAGGPRRSAMTDDALLDRRRAQLGASILGSVSGDQAVARAGNGWWLVLSGAPSPDGNLGMVFSHEAEVLCEVAAQVERSGFPTALLTAGDAPDRRLSPQWEDAGLMPFMAVDLETTRLADDPRVRRAAPSDLRTVVDLLAETYGLQPDIATAIAEPVLVGAAPIWFWLLEDAGAAVSTVMSAHHEDVVTIWCMATARDLQRRGYGGALLAHVLAVARDDGAEVGLLGASPAGEPLYRSTGWRTLEHLRVHVSAASVQHAH
jgi:GNAT superfamily N-acetyltransferase